MLHSYQKPLTGKSVGVVFGSFAPLHQGHLDLIMQAKKENDGGCIVIVCGYDGDKGEPLMPHKKRYRYVREFFADDDLVAVYAINETEINAAPYPNGWIPWLNEFDKIWCKAIKSTTEPERIWYVGDEDYYNDLTNLWNQKAVLVDRKATNPISATMIRENPIKHWEKITFPFRRVFSTNILICGTASEGKSVMTTDLGKYFNAIVICKAVAVEPLCNDKLLLGKICVHYLDLKLVSVDKLAALLGIDRLTATLTLIDPKDKPSADNANRIKAFCEQLKSRD